jgi:glycosyltransferase 2 family protein
MKTSNQIKNLFNFLFRGLLSIALLAYLYSKIDIERTVVVLKTADLKFIGLAFLAFDLIIVSLFFRWLIFIKALRLNTSLSSIARYYLIGLFGNLFLPSAIGGDVVKVLGLCRNSEQKAKVVASVLLDRLSGFGGMVIVAFLSFLIGRGMINDAMIAFSILAMAMVSSSLVAILFHERLFASCSNIFRGIPKLKSGLMNLHYDVALLKGRRDAIYQAVGVSGLCQVFLAGTYYLLAKALHQDVAFIYIMIFVPLICVASSVPSIGGLGVREAGAAYLLAKVGVESGVAVSLSLMTFIFMVVIGLVGGLIFWLTSPSVAIFGQTQQLATKNSRD